MKRVIQERDSYKTKVGTNRKYLDLVRTPDGVLHIDVLDIPNCTWTLVDDCFMCSHDDYEVETFTDDHFGFDGHYQSSYEGYVCIECGEALEGSPEEDKYDNMVDAQIMSALGK